jgi:para-nitrobenzyl esterase
MKRSSIPAIEYRRRLKCLGLLLLLSAASAACSSAASTNNSGGDAKNTSSIGAQDAGPQPAQPTQQSGDDLMLSLADGKVQGDMAGTTRLFLKIPFAKPPIGDLRWKAPVKNDGWSGVRHETDFAQPCAQLMSSGSPESKNEDCLYLNVWAPKPAPTNAPVMVWIHGGGNFAGSAFDHVPTSNPPRLWFNGQYFAANHGVVLVTINYRLGPMGFFAHPALAAEHSPLGNQGLLDQRAALQWVQTNIAKFGGDPANVTIFGESAGSADVCYHVASPLSRGLFQRAVSQSGGCTTGPMGANGTPSAAAVASGMAAFAQALGCNADSDPLACLRSRSVDDIYANAMQPNPTGGPSTPPMWSFSVVVDGAGGFLPDQPAALFDQGNVAKVSYILGSNNDEGTLFTYTQTPPKNDAEYLAGLKQRYGDSADQIAAQYPVSKFNGDYGAAMARVVGDSGLVCGTHDSARRATKAGLKVFMYNFNVPWSVSPTTLKASHASEISHVFGDPYLPTPDAASQAVADAMNAYWARFAKSGDPNGAGAPATWPEFNPDADNHDKRLQLDPTWQVVDDFRRDECTMWRAIYAATSK